MLKEKAMLVKLTIHQWTGKRVDKKVSREIEQTYDAKDAGIWYKFLLHQDLIKTVQKRANKIRKFHYHNTLPWFDDGTRLLPTANFFDYRKGMSDRINEFKVVVNEIVKEYQGLKQAARERLGKMFNETDYPDRIDDKYGVDVVFLPIPDGDDFRISLEKDVMDEIRNKIRDEIEKSVERANRDLWNRLYTHVKNMAERLLDVDAKFRDSLVGNLVELCRLLPKLNITNDPELDKRTKEIYIKLCKYSPQELRDDESVRLEVGENAQEILEKLRRYVER